MLIEDRITALYNPIRDCGAAIDAARVLATITGKPHVLYHDVWQGHTRWHVRTAECNPRDYWTRTGGIYGPNDERSSISMDPELVPELAEERGVKPIVDPRSLAAEYRRLVVGGPARPIDD